MPGTRKLGRTTDHRISMLRGMVTYLFENGRIETTVTRAKEVRAMANFNNEEKEAEAIARMSALNVEIAATEGLNENYQIGASYFLKLKNIDFDQLWSDYLHPLLQEYINGMYDEEGIMERFKKAYNQGKSDGADVDESN